MFLATVFLPGIAARADDPQDEGKLRRVEDKINKPKEADAARDAARQKEAEKERRTAQERDRERERWKRDHPGEPVPEWVGSADGGDLWSEVAFIALAAPFAGPYYLLDEHYDEPFGYERYPFAEGSGGCTKYDGKKWMINADMTGQYISSSTMGVRTDMTWAFWRRFAFEGAYTQYEERLKTRHEFLSFGEGLMTFMFAHNDFADFRAGVGIQTVNGKDLNSGLKGVYRIRWFHRPFQFNLDLGLTTGLGGSSLSEIAPGVGFHLGRTEMKFAYRRLKIGDERLCGPEISLRWWF